MAAVGIISTVTAAVALFRSAVAAICRVRGKANDTSLRWPNCSMNSALKRPPPRGMISRVAGSLCRRSVRLLIRPNFSPNSTNSGATTATNASTEQADSQASLR
ncbi:hypothetical protein ALO79_200263 [Pseudomonas syringae pv. castaneae]|uniref:Uncharacterized protein n=1 Tax=Pseudomonas syringae pv. castaneae TaxID=264450 RepID=A0A0P9N2C0_PSESX|nr:hypothetical protein ALO79_200263 [Pseudomonas syringae pv. castaneae]